MIRSLDRYWYLWLGGGLLAMWLYETFGAPNIWAQNVKQAAVSKILNDMMGVGGVVYSTVPTLPAVTLT